LELAFPIIGAYGILILQIKFYSKVTCKHQ